MIKGTPLGDFGAVVAHGYKRGNNEANIFKEKHVNQELIRRITNHVEAELKNKVTGIKQFESRYFYGHKFSIYLVTIDKPEEPDWWQICMDNGFPAVLISRKRCPLKEEAFLRYFECIERNFMSMTWRRFFGELFTGLIQSGWRLIRKLI